MSIKEIIDAILKLLEILATWPVLFFVVGALFYDELKNALPNLLSRLKKAPGGWEFNELQEVKAEVAALVNKSEVDNDRLKQALKIDPNQIQLSHSSEPVDQKYWRVRVWLEAPTEFLAMIDKIVYERHPTFKDHFKEVKSTPFSDSFKCWGAFTIKAEIHLKDGQVLKRQRFLSLN